VYVLLGKEFHFMTKEYILNHMTRMQIHLYLEQLIDIKLREAGKDSDGNDSATHGDVVEVSSGAELRAMMGIR
jgi:hypothetical protein